VSKHSFSDPEWELVFPAVRQLAAEAGLTDIAARQDKPGNRDMRFTSDDGRMLMFGSRVASVVTGKIACRRSASS
jgi:predicted LppA-like lipoprotein